MTNKDFHKYKHLINKCISDMRCYHTKLMDRWDYFQVGCVGLIKAMNNPDFDPNGKNPHGYIYRAIHNELCNYFRTLNRRANYKREVAMEPEDEKKTHTDG